MCGDGGVGDGGGGAPGKRVVPSTEALAEGFQHPAQVRARNAAAASFDDFSRVRRNTNTGTVCTRP